MKKLGLPTGSSVLKGGGIGPRPQAGSEAAGKAPPHSTEPPATPATPALVDVTDPAAQTRALRVIGNDVIRRLDGHRVEGRVVEGSVVEGSVVEGSVDGHHETRGSPSSGGGADEATQRRTERLSPQRLLLETKAGRSLRSFAIPTRCAR